MRFKVLILITVLIILNCGKEKLLFELKEERRFSALEMFPLDINKDEFDEILSVQSGAMALLEQKGKFIWDFHFKLLFGSELRKNYASVADFNNDGLKEIFLNFPESLTQIIYCYNSIQSGGLIRRLVTIKAQDRTKDGKWDGRVNAVGNIDANDDGNSDLLLEFFCGFDWQPRGLAVYDMKAGKEIWHYWIGPFPSGVIIEDVNDDGKPEIILGTRSPCNGSEANNFVDWESYVIVFDRKGNLLWHKKMGKGFSFTSIAASDIDADGRKEIISSLCFHGVGEAVTDRLLILDGKTGREKKGISTGENFWGLACVDLNHDGKDEILTGNSDGEIRVFNSDLDEIGNFQSNTGINLTGVCDLNGDGRSEIITTTEDGKLIILNEKLKKIAQMEIEKNITGYRLGENFDAEVKPVRAGKQNKLLIRITKETGDEFILYSFVPIAFVERPIFLPLLMLILIILIAFLGYLYARKTLIPKIQFSTTDLLKKAKEGYIILSKKGKVLFANEAAEKILGREKLDGIELRETLPFEASEILKEEEGEIIIKGKRIISFKREKIKKGFLLRIEDRTKEEHLKRVEDWAGVAQKLAHGIKNPLSTILGSVEQIEVKCEDSGIKKYIGYVKDEVTKLKKMTDAFMRFTKMAPPVLAPKNINELIKKIIEKYETSLLGKIVIKGELDENLPLINFDEEGIFNALNIIIENGIEAIMAKGKENRSEDLGILRIRSLLAERLEKGVIKNYVRIEISDTGTGIPERYLEKVFEPYFTYNKPLGTGLGLTLAKKIIEDHKGYIEIHSKEGVGTEVNVYLPLS